MINCRKCGRGNEDHYRFCLGCGARLENQREAHKVHELPPEEQTRSINLASLSKMPIVGSESAAAKPAPITCCWKCEFQIDPGNVFCGKCGSPARPPQDLAKKTELVIIQPDGSEGHRIHLKVGVHSVGRSDLLFADDPFISPSHARFTLHEDGRLTVGDLESLNGTFIRLKEKTELEHGDQLRIGLELLEFHSPDKLPTLARKGSDARFLGSSKPSFWGRLERIATPDACSHAFLLENDDVIVGRDRGEIVFHSDHFVSGTHARFSNGPGGPSIEDLNSSNGTYLRLRGVVDLCEGDMLLIGQRILMVSLP